MINFLNQPVKSVTGRMLSQSRRLLSVLIIFSLFSFSSFADVRLPAIIASNMVLQQQSQANYGAGATRAKKYM